jgi:hypothetical protein
MVSKSDRLGRDDFGSATSWLEILHPMLLFFSFFSWVILGFVRFLREADEGSNTRKEGKKGIENGSLKRQLEGNDE